MDIKVRHWHHKDDSVWSQVGFGENTLYAVGILADSTLWNPDKYPEKKVREAVLAAQERDKQKRSTAAKKGAQERSTRQERQTAAFAKRNVAGERIFGPRAHCAICSKAIDDPQSVERGIGSDCWQNILRYMQAA
jgi:hypothetical protein